MTEMASHLVRAGGKRLRPLLAALSSHRPATGRRRRVTTSATTPSPAAWPASWCTSARCTTTTSSTRPTTRHGVESVNARWGNLRAILSGDFLLARASELAASLGTEVAGLLAATIGRLCEGEVRELQLAYQVDRSVADYAAAIEGKTAALFSTACRIGGIVAEPAPRPRSTPSTDFGLHYGMAFQVVDDILDVVATDDELGKPAGHDMAEGVYNLPVLRTLAGRRRRRAAGRCSAARSTPRRRPGRWRWCGRATAWRSRSPRPAPTSTAAVAGAGRAAALARRPTPWPPRPATCWPASTAEVRVTAHEHPHDADDHGHDHAHDVHAHDHGHHARPDDEVDWDAQGDRYARTRHHVTHTAAYEPLVVDAVAEAPPGRSSTWGRARASGRRLLARWTGAPWWPSSRRPACAGTPRRRPPPASTTSPPRPRPPAGAGRAPGRGCRPCSTTSGDLGACARELRRVLAPGAPVLIRGAFAGRFDDCRRCGTSPRCAAGSTGSRPSTPPRRRSATAGFRRRRLDAVDRAHARPAGVAPPPARAAARPTRRSSGSPTTSSRPGCAGSTPTSPPAGRVPGPRSTCSSSADGHDPARRWDAVAMRVTARVDYAVRAATGAGRSRTPARSPPRPSPTARPCPWRSPSRSWPACGGPGSWPPSGAARAATGSGRPPDQVSVADIVRAVEGPLADVRGEPPEELDYPGDGEVLRRLWIATRASLRSVLEHVTVADLANGELPGPASTASPRSPAPGTAADRSASARVSPAPRGRSLGPRARPSPVLRERNSCARAAGRRYVPAMPIVPDTKDWTWVLERPCPECGFDASALPPERVRRPRARQRRRVAARSWPGPGPSSPPGPTDDRWSALEYACHVRDVLRLYDQRLALMLTEDDPDFANWDQDETAVADRYDEQDPARGRGGDRRGRRPARRPVRLGRGRRLAAHRQPQRRRHVHGRHVRPLLRPRPVHHLDDVAKGLRRARRRRRATPAMGDLAVDTALEPASRPTRAAAAGDEAPPPPRASGAATRARSARLGHLGAERRVRRLPGAAGSRPGDGPGPAGQHRRPHPGRGRLRPRRPRRHGPAHVTVRHLGPGEHGAGRPPDPRGAGVGRRPGRRHARARHRPGARRCRATTSCPPATSGSPPSPTTSARPTCRSSTTSTSASPVGGTTGRRPGPLDPTVHWWNRFLPTAGSTTPGSTPAGCSSRSTRWAGPPPRWPTPTASRATVAVTVDLSVRFHRPADDEWLLAEATAPLATGGLVAATGRVWDRSGALLASGGQTMLCRPARRRLRHGPVAARRR